MREDLDAILEFIGSESLTDLEFDSIELESMDDQALVYESLLGVLQSREVVTATVFRLQNYFLAMGVQVVPVTEISGSISNIFVGAPLEDLDDDN